MDYIKTANLLRANLERLNKRSEYLDHHLALTFSEKDWGFAHAYAFLKFVCATNYKRLTKDAQKVYDQIDMKALDSAYEENVSEEIRKGPHWFMTSKRNHRYSGDAEKWFKSRKAS